MNADWSARVFVGNSAVHGLGLFVRRDFATGETVVLRHDRLVTPEAPLDPEQGEVERHCAVIAGGQKVYLGFPARFLNHSCDANCFVRYRGGGTAEIVALRPIQRHAEATIHYGIDRWGRESMVCSCGSDRCLGTLPGSFFDLPLEAQLELSPLLSEWFVAEHRREYGEFLERVGLDEIQLD